MTKTTTMPKKPWGPIKGMRVDHIELAQRSAAQAQEPMHTWLGEAIEEKAARQRSDGEVIPPGQTRETPTPSGGAVVPWTPERGGRAESLAALMQGVAALAKVRVREPGLKAALFRAAADTLGGHPNGADPAAREG